MKTVIAAFISTAAIYGAIHAFRGGLDWMASALIVGAVGSLVSAIVSEQLEKKK